MTVGIGDNLSQKLFEHLLETELKLLVQRLNRREMLQSSGIGRIYRELVAARKPFCLDCTTRRKNKRR
jgi:hypothetical protein